MLGTLQPREAEILRARYGLQDGKLKTLEEVGEIFDVSLLASTFPCPSLCCTGMVWRAPSSCAYPATRHEERCLDVRQSKSCKRAADAGHFPFR